MKLLGRYLNIFGKQAKIITNFEVFSALCALTFVFVAEATIVPHWENLECEVR